MKQQVFRLVSVYTAHSFLLNVITSLRESQPFSFIQGKFSFWELLKVIHVLTVFGEREKRKTAHNTR